MSNRCEPDYFAMNDPPVGLVALIVLIYFFADGIAAAVIHSQHPNGAAEVFVVTVFVSQAMLLTLWLGLGNSALSSRFLLSLAWCGWAVILAIPHRELKPETFAGALLYLLVGAVPYGILKVLGFRIVFSDQLTDPSRLRQPSLFQNTREPHEGTVADYEMGFPASVLIKSRRSGVQFSILQMFGWTALVGLMATLSRIAGIPLDYIFAPEFAIPVGVLTALGLATLWAVLGSQRVGDRIIVPFGLVIVTTVIVPTLIGRDSGEAIGYMFLTLVLTTGIVAAVLTTFRLAGYRVGRRASAMIEKKHV